MSYRDRVVATFTVGLNETLRSERVVLAVWHESSMSSDISTFALSHMEDASPMDLLLGNKDLLDPDRLDLECSALALCDRVRLDMERYDRERVEPSTFPPSGFR